MKSIEYSVLISLYKNEDSKYFDKSLESIVKQSLPPNQIVLVIDGPITNDLEAVINKYKNNQESIFEIVKLDNNVGLGKALNIGLRLCSNELVARMDTDDIAMINRMEKQTEYLSKHPEIDILGCFANDIDANGDYLKHRILPIMHNDIEKLIWTNPIIHPSVIYKKSKIIKIGSYDESIRRRQDYELWFRAMANGLIFGNLPEPLILYRLTDDYFKKNNLKQQINQLKIGLKGCIRVKASPVAYLGLFAPIIRGITPSFLRKPVVKMMDIFDPRGKE